MSRLPRTLVPILTLVLLLVSGQARAQAVSMPKWQGGVAFDSGVRSMLRAPTGPERQVADDASSVLLYSLVAAPFLAGAARTAAAHGSLRDMAGSRS